MPHAGANQGGGFSNMRRVFSALLVDGQECRTASFSWYLLTLPVGEGADLNLGSHGMIDARKPISEQLIDPWVLYV